MSDIFDYPLRDQMSYEDMIYLIEEYGPVSLDY